MSVSKEAVEAAAREMRRFFNQSVPNLDYDQGAQDIITAALPHCLAAKNAEIAALREVLKRTLAWTEEYREDYSDVPAERDRVDLAIAEARAALKPQKGEEA